MKKKKERKIILRSQARWCTPIIPEFRRQRQKANEFKASLGYIARLYLNKINFKRPLSAYGPHKNT
jgi:hypothetical protein